MSSAIHAALAARDPDALSAAVYDELIPVIPSATDPATWDPREFGLSGGNVWKAVAWQDKLWWRDDTSVAAADNITVIILADGGHYLTNDVTFPITVESRTIAAPPDSAGTSPTVIGKAWRLPVAATGTWAGHDYDIAMGSARGWQFHAPVVGEEHNIRSENLYEQFRNDNLWHDREASLGSQTVPLSAELWDGRVQNQTTNAQPTIIIKGTAHIIGPSPTGLKWAGNPGKLSISEIDNDVTVYTPWVGLTVYDIALGNDVRWNGTAWISAAGAVVDTGTVFTASGTGASRSGSTYYSYSDTSAPAGSNLSGCYDSVALTYTAKRAGNAGSGDYNLILDYQARTSIANTSGVSDTKSVVAALFRDAETTAVDWVSLELMSNTSATINGLVQAHFEIAASDATSHSYKVVVLDVNASVTVQTLTRRRLSLMERA